MKLRRSLSVQRPVGRGEPLGPGRMVQFHDDRTRPARDGDWQPEVILDVEDEAEDVVGDGRRLIEGNEAGRHWVPLFHRIAVRVPGSGNHLVRPGWRRAFGPNSSRFCRTQYV